MSKTTDNPSSQPSAAHDARPAKRPREDEASDGVPSKYRIVKDGWGSRPEFQRSYLLGMDLDGLEEGDTVLEGFQDMDARTLEDENADLRSFEEGQATLEDSQQMECQTSQEHNVESVHIRENGGQGYFEEEEDGQGYSGEEDDGQEYFEQDYFSSREYYQEMIAERAYCNEDDGLGFEGGYEGCGGWGVNDDDDDVWGFEGDDGGCGGWEVNDSGWGSPGGNA